MIRIRPMTVADLPLGMRLKAQAGWNQTEADWRRYLRLGREGCFVAELDGSAVGTTATFIFNEVAWVAMVLVDEAARGHGIGTALMQHALAFLDERGIRSVRLDATPLGRPIYEKLGFVAEYTLARYEGVLRSLGRDGPVVEPVAAGGLTQALRLDWEVTQTVRIGLLMRLFDEDPDVFRMVRRGEEYVAFLASRPGSNARQLGPLAAKDEAAARALLADAATRYAGARVFIDVPRPNLAAVRVVEATGLTTQRELLRMGRGQPVRERIEWLWASSGPEKG
jgi:GNAT superfamily N-acetyltransferase